MRFDSLNGCLYVSSTRNENGDSGNRASGPWKLRLRFCGIDRSLGGQFRSLGLGPNTYYKRYCVRDLEALYGFFRRKDYTAGGARVSLLYLENEIIRKRYREARIHFGIVCASIVARDSREMRLQGII